jgi:hypothetical protein
MREIVASSTYDELTILHVRVNRTEDVAIHPEAANFVCDKGDYVLLSWRETETPVIVMNYCESVYFSAVIVDDGNDHRVALMDSNDRPLCSEGFVVATVNPRERVRRVRLYNGKMKNLTAR